MGKVFERKSSTNRHIRFTDHAYGNFAAEKELLRTIRDIVQASQTLALVQNECVDIEARTWTCLAWQDLKIPCHHAIAFLRRVQAPIESFIDPVHSLEAYRAAYASTLRPVALSSVGIDDTLPPLNARAAEGPRPTGRPSTRKRGVKRVRNDAERHVQRRALNRATQEEATAAAGATFVAPRTRHITQEHQMAQAAVEEQHPE